MPGDNPLMDEAGRGAPIRRIVIFAAALAIAACGRTPSDPLEGLPVGERGRVVRVIDGDALVLSSGQSVRLIGIEAPAGPYQEREGEPGYDEAKRTLEDMALGREVELRYGGLTRDRYDRALAHVVTTDALGPDLWLNAEMVRRGYARVRIYPDTAAANDRLLPMEASARAAGAGLWARPAWALTQADSLPDTFTGFQLAEGVTAGMQGSDFPGVSCEVMLESSLLVLEIESGAAAYCQLDPQTRIRARGYVRNLRMEINHPLNVEILDTP